MYLFALLALLCLPVPAHAGWVEDVHAIWDMVVNGLPNAGGGMVPTLKHTNCHAHNADCRADPFNPHCWDPDPWPQRCDQGGKAGFECDLNPTAPFCQTVPPAGCVGAYMTRHPACATTTTTLPPSGGVVARWEIGFNAIGVRLTDGACAIRKFPNPSSTPYNTTCALPQGTADGVVTVGVDIPPMVVNGLCYNFLTPPAGVDHITHAVLRNGAIIPGSVITSTGHGAAFCQAFPQLVLETGDVLQAGRDLEPFDCDIACTPVGGTCVDASDFCAGIAMGTEIELLQ